MSLVLAHRAATLWGLLPETVALVAARENKIFSASDGQGWFAIRLHREGYSSEVEIHSELVMLDALGSRGMTVPVPRLSANRKMVEQVDGQLVSVISWLPGAPIAGIGRSQEPHTRTAGFHALGATLARFHETADQWTPPAGFQRRRWDAAGLLGQDPLWGRFWENPTLTGDEQHLLKTARDRARDDLGECVHGLDFGLIHADALRENVLIDGGKVNLIDFDDAGYGFRLFDLATSLVKYGDDPDAADLRKALIGGYHTERRLDTAHLDLFLLIRSLNHVGWVIPRMKEPGVVDRCKSAVAMAIRHSSAYLNAV